MLPSDTADTLPLSVTKETARELTEGQTHMLKGKRFC